MQKIEIIFFENKNIEKIKFNKIIIKIKFNKI